MASLSDHIVVHLEAQPPPKRGEARPTSHLVVEDMLEKYDAGALKYGMQHQHDNGRDHVVDAYQEVLDLACYLRAEIEKRRGWNADAAPAELAVALADVQRARLDRAAATEEIANLVAERGERLRQLERAADENNRLITAQTKAISERDVAIAERNVATGTLRTLAEFTGGRYVAEKQENGLGWLLTEKKEAGEASTEFEVNARWRKLLRETPLENIAEPAVLEFKARVLKSDAAIPAPAGYVDERDHRRALAQLEAMTKERDGAVHALGAAKSERDMARKSLAEAQHEVEASRKLYAEHQSEDAVREHNRAMQRRCGKIVELIDSCNPGFKELPAVKEIRGYATGEKKP